MRSTNILFLTEKSYFWTEKQLFAGKQFPKIALIEVLKRDFKNGRAAATCCQSIDDLI